MNIAGVLAAIPKMSPAERRVIEDRAKSWLETPAKASAAQQVIDALDEREKSDANERAVHVASLPIAQRVLEAFRHQPPTDTEAKLISSLLNHPGSTSAELTKAMGWEAQTWHLHFGTMCKNRQDRLWPAEPSMVRNADFYSGILADFSDDNRWTMRPDVAAAFERLGLKAKSANGAAQR